MSKLPRVTNKLYGSNIDLEDIGQFGSAQSGSKVNTKDIPTIQGNEAWTKGWTYATMSNNKYPTRQERNGMDYSFSYQIDYLLREGWPEYDAGTEYNKHSVVKAVEGGRVVVYESLIDNNIGFLLTNASAWQKVSFGGSGLELCDIGTALYIDETKGLRRILNGSIMDITANYQPFLARLQQITTLYPSLVCTEDEWQTTKTMSKLGQCGKFVYNYGTDGTTVTSVRLPAVVNINGLADMSNAGLIKDESLPNITGKGETGSSNQGIGTGTGAISLATSTISAGGGAGGDNLVTTTFNASKSSSTYQDNAPVQQEAIQYPYFIQIATGSETENNIVNDIELNNPYTLFDSKYVEAPLYNVSWLNGSTGEYYSGAVYVKAYEALVVENNVEIEVGTTVTLPSGTSYTKRGLSIKLHTSEDITDYDFVLNTENQTFRLPKKNGEEDEPSSEYIEITPKTNNTKYVAPANGNLVCLGTSEFANQYVELHILKDPSGSITEKSNMTLVVNNYSAGANNGVFCTLPIKKGETGVLRFNMPTLNYFRFVPNVGNGSLYYYVGETVQNANLIDAGRIAERMVDKSNLRECSVVVETYQNGSSWYRLWSDNWLEQGGIIPAANSGNITFLKNFIDTNYGVTSSWFTTKTSTDTGGYDSCLGIANATTTGFRFSGVASTSTGYWVAMGYSA